MTYGQVNNQWGLIDKDGKLYEGSAFGNEIVSALNKLRTESGEFGAEFINTIVDAEEIVSIKETNKNSITSGSVIYLNVKSSQDAPTEVGNTKIAVDLTLGHELDHAFNNAQGVKFENGLM